MVYIIWMVGQYPIEPLSGSEHSSNAGLLLHHGENAGPIHAEGDGLRRAVISDSHGRRTIVAEITSSLRAAAIDCPAPGKAAHRRRRAEGGRCGRQLTPGRGVQRGCGRRQPERRLVGRLARGRRRAAPAPAAADGARAAARGPVGDIHDVGLPLGHAGDPQVASRVTPLRLWSPSRDSQAKRHSQRGQPVSLRPAEPGGRVEELFGP